MFTKKELERIRYLTEELKMWQEEAYSLSGIDSTKPTPKNRRISDPTGDKVADTDKIIEEKKKEIQQKRKEIIEYICGIDDSLVRQIVKYRCVNLMTWNDIAGCIGGGNTADSVRKIYERYLLSTMSGKDVI